MEGQRRWRKEGSCVCVCSYLQYLISFVQHTMSSNWTLGMHILNHMMDAPCTEQNTQTMIKQDRKLTIYDNLY